jgi:hypothetical protein
MDGDLLNQATEIWDNGQFLATHVNSVLNSLYRYDGKLFVIWYNKKNSDVKKIEEVDLEKARELFEVFIGR